MENVEKKVPGREDPAKSKIQVGTKPREWGTDQRPVRLQLSPRVGGVGGRMPSERQVEAGSGRD